MSKTEELIQQLCPDGVEHKKLGDLCEIRTGKLNANAKVENGLYPFFTCDALPFRINTYSFDTEAILVSGNGSQIGHINYYNGKFDAYQRTYVLSNFNYIDIKFLLHFLKAYLREYIMLNSNKGSVPYITLPMLQDYLIPVPPIEIQQEIVRSLDTYVEAKEGLLKNLNTELELRKKQYEFYREKLLSFEGKNVEWKSMGEIGEFVRGNGLQKKDFVDSGVGCIHYGQIYTYYGTWTEKTKTFVTERFAKKLRKAKFGDIVIATTSENVEDVCKAVAWLGNEDICVSGDAYIYRHTQNAKFLSYLTQTNFFLIYKRKSVTGTKVMRVSGDSMSQYKIPIPPLAEQERIVSLLERFEAATQELTENLTQEIAHVQQQYEYYRDKLLTFKA